MKTIYHSDAGILYHGHVIDVLRELEPESVHCVVTSVPYWGLRSYGTKPQLWGGDPNCKHLWVKSGEPGGNGTGISFRRDREAGRQRGARQPGFCMLCNAWKGELGLEPNPYMFVDHLVTVFQEIKRVLRKDGTVWLNIGDTYYTGAGKDGGKPGGGNRGLRWIKQLYPQSFDELAPERPSPQPNRLPVPGLKPKDLCMIPHRVALALQADGWWVRQDIVWSKPNPLPESVKDRCTKAHEYLFLLSKSKSYYFDADSIKESASPDTHARYARGRSNNHKWADGGPGNQTIAKSFAHMRKPSGRHNAGNYHGEWLGKTPGVNPKAMASPPGCKQNASFSASVKDIDEKRNKRSVWTIATQAFSGAHFATFPPDLVEPCILAGCPRGGTVLDPFAGSATTGIVAHKHDRKFILIDLQESYCKNIAKPRLEKATQQRSLFL